jgi:hypothetical protein
MDMIVLTRNVVELVADDDGHAASASQLQKRASQKRR